MGAARGMNERDDPRPALLRRNVAFDGEHPDVIVGDVNNRPRPDAQVIVIANEKGGVGKSTIAFQLCIALADAGLRVAALDLDRRQQTLAQTLLARQATGRRLKVSLPMARPQILQVPSGAMLCQDMCRVGWDADIIVIDAAGFDSPIARRAIALADTLVTPVNTSFVDLDLLGRFNPVSLDVISDGCFTIAVNEIRAARIRSGLKGLDWVVVQNRMRKDASLNHDRTEAALRKLSDRCGFRIAGGLAERVAYRELFLLGLTHLDIRRIPYLGRSNPDALREVLSLVTDLAIDKANREPSLLVDGKNATEDILDLRSEWQEAVVGTS